MKNIRSNNPGAIIIEGHIQGLSNTRSLGEAGITVYVVDRTNCIAHYSKYCKKFFRCPDFIKDEFTDFLIKLAITENIKDWVLIPSNDHAVINISKHKKRLEEYYKVITPPLDIIQNIYDKSRLLKLAEDVGVSIPESFYFQSVDEVISNKLPYPVIIKGRNSLSFYKATGRKAFLAENEKELKEQLNRISEKINILNTLTQEVIPSEGTNNTVSFTAFCVEGVIKTYWMGKKLREHPLQFGTATFCISTHCKELIEPSAKLVKLLNYTGVCEIEYLKDPRDELYKLIEINARTWLWVDLAKTCGVDYAKIIYNYFFNSNDISQTKYEIGLKWINWFTDLPVSTILLIKGKINPVDYFKSIKGKKKTATFNLNDIKPSFAYFLLAFSFFRNR